MGLDVAPGGGTQGVAGTDIESDAAANTGRLSGQPARLWNLEMNPGQSREIEIATILRPNVSRVEATMLITLEVQGSPPRMFWSGLGE